MSEPSRPAVVKFGDASFDVLEPGDFVTCAVTGKRIPIADLRYWSAERQEAYADAGAATEALAQRTRR